MNILPSYGPPRSRRTSALALTAAVMLVLMTLAQLYGYEDQPTIISTLMPFDDQPLSTVVAAMIVLAQLLSLPYLLGMYLSKLMRLFSAFVGLGVSAFWLFTALTNAHAQNAGLFSSTFELQGGITAALWTMALFACVTTVAAADSKFRHDTSS